MHPKAAIHLIHRTCCLNIGISFLIFTDRFYDDAQLILCGILVNFGAIYYTQKTKAPLLSCRPYKRYSIFGLLWIGKASIVSARHVMQQSTSAAIYAQPVNRFFQPQYHLGQRSRLIMAVLDRLPLPGLSMMPRIQTVLNILR